MSFDRGDVLIALFPHADGSGYKARPVLVIQSDVYNAKINNLLVAEITGNLAHATDPASFLIDVKSPDGKLSGLRRNSLVSCINIATLNEARVSKKIGALTDALMQKVNDCLKVALYLP